MRHLFAAALLAVAPVLSAGEGMWTLDNLPRAAIAESGFTPDADWIAHVQRASVRLAGGCSGSFVSPDGLVLTNHHCAWTCAEQLSSADENLLRASDARVQAQTESARAAVAAFRALGGGWEVGAAGATALR